MSNTAGAKAWRFLKRNPHCIGARRKVPGATPDETAPFPIGARVCWRVDKSLALMNGGYRELLME